MRATSDSPTVNAEPWSQEGLPTALSMRSAAGRLLRRLEAAFRQPFAVLDVTTARLERVDSDWLPCDFFSRVGLCAEVARRGKAEVIEDFAPLLTLAVPLRDDETSQNLVAVSTFLTTPTETEADIAAAAETLGVDPTVALRWAGARIVWPPFAVVELARSLVAESDANLHLATAKVQLSDVSSNLLATFEELSLLHRLTEHLSLSITESELCERALGWLSEVLPARCLAIRLQRSTATVTSTGDEETLVVGDCPIDEQEFGTLIGRLGPQVDRAPVVLNRNRTSSPTWHYPQIRELVSIPIRGGDQLIGYLLAINFKANTSSAGESEFSTVETSMLASVAAILGIHAGNLRLYSRQSDLFASSIRAMSSAIDAKDPYTSGHSDRVARIAVTLARKLNCTADELNTIYLGGLLHDVGKIGIEDQVLRKPGKLTPEEYDHIKTHPELGERILHDVAELRNILPIVLHHHEAWDGSGYPAQLVGDQTPRLARITAVADSIDAMSSDRPYRKGMPQEKLEIILREGAARQWDPAVIAAYFAARDEVRDICNTDRQLLDLDVGRWNREAAL